MKLTKKNIKAYFLSDLNDLEDKFIGIKINSNLYIERILYIDYGKSIEKFHKVRYQNYSNFKYDYSSLNYSEIDYSIWEYYLHIHKEKVLHNEINLFFDNLDEFILSKKNNQIIKFTLNTINNIILTSVDSLKKSFTLRIDGTYNLNKYQELLINIFISIYEEYLNKIKTSIYSTYITVLPQNVTFTNSLQKIIKKSNLPHQYEEITNLLLLNYSEKQVYSIILTLTGIENTSKEYITQKIKTTPLFYTFCNEFRIIGFLVDLFGNDKDSIGEYLDSLASINTHFDSSAERFKEYFIGTYNKTYPPKKPEKARNIYALKDKNLNTLQLFKDRLEKL